MIISLNMGFSLDAPPGGARVYDYKSHVKSPGCEQSGWDIYTQYISNTSYSKKIVYISIDNKRESERDECGFLFLNILLYINKGVGGGVKEHQGNIPNFGEILRACVEHFLWEEAVEIGEPNDPNDGTAQCNHHLFLKMQSETHSQTPKRGIRLYFASQRNYQHWSTLAQLFPQTKAEQRVIEVCVQLCV